MLEMMLELMLENRFSWPLSEHKHSDQHCLAGLLLPIESLLFPL